MLSSGSQDCSRILPNDCLIFSVHASGGTARYSGNFKVTNCSARGVELPSGLDRGLVGGFRSAALDLPPKSHFKALKSKVQFKFHWIKLKVSSKAGTKTQES